MLKSLSWIRFVSCSAQLSRDFDCYNIVLALVLAEVAVAVAAVAIMVTVAVIEVFAVNNQKLKAFFQKYYGRTDEWLTDRRTDRWAY